MVNVGFGLHFGWAWLRLVEKVLWRDRIQFWVAHRRIPQNWLRLVEKVLRRQVLRLTWQRLIVAYQLECQLAHRHMQVGQFMRELEACLDLTQKQYEVAVDSYWRGPRTNMWLFNQ